MARYILQEKQNDNSWRDTNIVYNTKLELDHHIGQYNIDYEYRVGFFFKPFNNPISRFIWLNGKNKGQEVKP